MSGEPAAIMEPAGPPVPGEARPVGHLDGALVSGLAWTGGMKWLGQALLWLSTFVVMRVLTPDDYGLVGMASVFLGMITLLSEFGLGAAVVMMRDLTSQQIAQLNGFAVLTGLAGFVLSLAVAVPIGRFFDAPLLPPVVVAMSLVFVITSFRIVPNSLMQRDLRFKQLAFVDGAQTVILAFCMVALALAGFRYWTLVLGSLIGAAVSTLMTWWLCPQAYAVPRLRSLRPALDYSRHIVTGRLGYYAYSHSDFLIAGKLLGSTALGFYTAAWSLASMPVDKISSLVVRVAPAFFSAVQHDRAAMRRYLLLLTQSLALVTFPLTFGLALVAPDFVTVVLGEKWIGAILPLQLLALYASFRSVSPLLAPVLHATGEQRYAARNSLLAAAVLPIGFLFGARWGTPGIAAAWMVLHPPVVMLVYRKVSARIELRLGTYLRALRPALLGSVAMAAAVVLAQLALRPVDRTLALAAEIATGGAVYIGYLFLFESDRIAAGRRLLASIRNRPDVTGSAAPAMPPAVSV